VNLFSIKNLFILSIVVLLVSCNRETKESFWENGNLKSKLAYKKGQLDGPAFWFYENGSKEQEVSYSLNKLNGNQKRWYQNGKLESEATYVDGMLQGNSFLYDQEGNKIIEEHYVNDTLHGKYLKFYPDKTIQIEGEYSKGLFSGSWIYYDLKGDVVGSGNFEKGTGFQKAWWPNGNLKREIFYQKNQKQGEEKWFDENGKLEKINIYENGILIN
jgi:antitoxin component YwqK of YwqJK toxin-antitoxin module